MSGLKAIVVAMASLFAMLSLGLGLWALAGFSGIEAGLASACVLLALAQFSNFATSGRDVDGLKARLGDLGNAVGTFARDIQSLKEQVEALDKSVDERAGAHTDQLRSEVQVLETLVKQLADTVTRANLHGVSHASPFAPAGKTGRGAMAHDREADKDDDEALLETIRKSLADNRVDLYLQPIVTLPQRKVRYYEGLSRLRDIDGSIIMPAAYLPLAEPAGMMPIIDNLLLFRCIQVVRRLVDRQRQVGVFCNISAHSLLDADFFPQFIEFMEHNAALSDSVIFEFSQRMVDAFGPLELESLSALAELGFHFSLDQVNNLDFDFKLISNLGFRYVKIDADILLNRMSEKGAQIHGADFREALARHGIELIAEKIEEEHVVVNLLDYEVELAQGFLFGEPKPVRHDLTAQSPQEVRASA